MISDTCIRHCLTSLKFGKSTTKLVKHHYHRHKRIILGLEHQKGLWKYATGGSKIKTEKLISGSLRGNFWQPLISLEARKERSCHSFSASHMGPRADCPFHRPAFFRPGASLKFVFREIGFNFPFRKNSNGIYPTSWALELQFENQWSFKKPRKKI